MRKEISKFYLISFIFEVARTIPHAFVTMYLLNSGISIYQISLIQIAYMIAIVICEVPSGVLADHISKKRLYLLSCILMLISFSLYINVYSFQLIVVAQFLYGVASALQTGSLDAIILNSINSNFDQSDQKKEYINEFFRKTEIICTFAMIVGSFLGSYLFYNHLSSKVYFISIILFVFSGIITLFMKDDMHKKSIESVSLKLDFYSNCVIHLKEGFKALISNEKLLILVSLSASLQFILQPFFNYWQPVSVIKGFSENYLNIIYIIMQITTILSAFLCKKIIKEKTGKNRLVLTASILSITLITSLLSPNRMIYLVLLLISIIPRTIAYIELNSNIQDKINNDFRSTITSISSLYTRIFSIIIFLIMGFISDFGISTIYVFIICTLIFFILVVLITKIKYLKDR